MVTTNAAPPRFRTVSAAGTIVALLLVLVFGSSIYRDWVDDHTSATDGGGFILRQLAWPGWSFDTDQSLRDLIATDLKAILVVVFTAVLLGLLAVAPGWGLRGILSAVVTGWAGFMFAAALAGLLAAFVASNATLVSAFSQAGGGAVYGLFAGWIVGLVSLAFRSR